MKKVKVFLLFTMFTLLIIFSSSTVSAKQYLTLHKQNGDTYKCYELTDKLIKLPSLKSTDGYTFLGWSTKPYQYKNPKYETGQTVKFTKNTHLYATKFKKSSEVNLSKSKLKKMYPDKFEHVVFVGDSRTVQMTKAVKKELGYSPKNVSFVAKGSMGIKWLCGEGQVDLIKLLDRYGHSSKPVAVIFNFGVNDLKRGLHGFISCDQTISDYVSYMSKLERQLNKYNCKIYYMSVNPINTLTQKNPYARREEEVRQFNQAIKIRLNGYQYIDMYSYMMRHGFSYCNENDGLHYGDRTYKRIYTYCMQEIAGR